MTIRQGIYGLALGAFLLTGCSSTSAQPSGVDAGAPTTTLDTPPTYYRSLSVNGRKIFFREAGDPALPTLVLLHGFPASSHQYRDLISDLSGRFHMIAPDYPGFGLSDAPSNTDFTYTFDALADIVDGLLAQLGVQKFALYVHDYGAPVGWRLVLRHPDALTALFVQNGIAYTVGLTDALAPLMAYWQDRAANEQGVRDYLKPETTQFIFLHGAADPTRISPDGWTLAQGALARPGNDIVQLDLFYDYRTNPDVFDKIQAYFREHQPPTLVTWGKGDPFFSEDAAHAYEKDLPDAEIHILDTGHFALEELHGEIATMMRDFAARTPSLSLASSR